MSEPDRPAPSAPPTPRPRRWPQRLLMAALMAIGVLLGLLLAGTAALGLWAMRDGSLGEALRWGEGFMGERAAQTGTLRSEAVQGSVWRGGHIGALVWSREGLTVRAEGVNLKLGQRLWLGLLGGRGAHLGGLEIERLVVQDERPPSPDTPSEPLNQLTLPLPVSLPWSVKALQVQGGSPLTLSELQGVYRYGPSERASAMGVQDLHWLDLKSLTIAGGTYQAQAMLGAQAPMPLRLDAQGLVQAPVPGGSAVSLDARAQVIGELAGADPRFQVQANAVPSGQRPGTPMLAATALIRPRAAQPLAEADIRVNRLNLAAWWPQAPSTELSGTVQARPQGEQWRAEARLSNGLSGPADRQRLPLSRLVAEVEQQGARWQLRQLDATVGDGQLQAQGWFERDGATPWGRFEGELKASGVNPQQVWSALAPAGLDGTAKAVAKADGGIDLNARVLPAGRQPRSSALAGLRLRDVQLAGQWKPQAQDPAVGRLTLREARAALADATLTLQGQADWPRLDIDGSLALQVPGAQATAKGRLAHAAGGGQARVDLQDAKQVLAWARSLGELPVLGAAVREAMAQAPGPGSSGSASLQIGWQGGLGALGFPGAGMAAAPSLSLRLTAPRLELAPAPGTAGVPIRIQDTELVAEGPASQIALSLRAQAEQAPWRGRIDTQGRLALAMGAQGLGDSGRLELATLQAQATDERQPKRAVQWTARTSGPLALNWQDLRGTPAIRLAPASLQVRPQVGGSSANLEPVTLAWEQIDWHAGALLSRGRLTGLPLAWADALTQSEGGGALTRAGLGGDLVVDGQWDIALPANPQEPPRLSARLQRRSGDIAVQTDGPYDAARLTSQRVQAGVRNAELSLATQGRQVNARLQWRSDQLGEASADVSTDLSPPGPGAPAWHWAADAPLRGRLQASLPQVGVWSALAPPGWRVRGTLALQAELAGTREKPQWSGSLQADDVALRSLVNGIAFVNGQLRATLAGDKLVIERFSLDGRGGAERGGNLVAQGSAQWRAVTREGVTQREPLIELQATARQWRVSTRADRRLTLSGQVRALLDGPALQLRGELKADSALIVLPDETAPSLGSDVVVRGTERPLESGLRVQPDVQVRLDLGDDFQLRGQGVQTRLSGQLDVRSTPAVPTPRLLGEVRTASGSYRAYGQQLTIETGVLRFTGPYDNPTLDITAVRPNSSQRVGVQVLGTAQAPRVRLFSDPELPDSEKLAWLVLGRPASGAGAEAAVLQQAALALLAGSGNTNGGVASALGLDDVSFSGNGTNADGSERSAALTFGKRISNDLYVSYERSIVGVLGTVSIFYDVSRRFTVRARAGEENAIDLIFTLQYD